MLNTENLIQEIKAKDVNPQYWDFKDNDKREHVHSMIKYPAVMVPNMQGEIFDIILKHDKDIQNVLDPFMGSGTILVEGLLRGLDVNGIDINPLSYLAVQVKLQNYNINILQKKSRELIKRINESSKYKLFEFENIDKWYKKDVIDQLSHIRSEILNETSLKYRQLFWLTFAEIAKQADNSRTSTFKLHIKESQDIEHSNFNCISNFQYKLFENITAISDYKKMLSKDKSKVHIMYGDSIKLLSDRRVFKPNSIDLVITSPPYGDNATTITYGQFSVLPLRWIPLQDISNKVSENVIKTLSNIDKNSLGGNKYSVHSILESDLFLYSEKFSSLYNKLSADMQIEKARKVASFLLNFEKVISSLHTLVKQGKFMVFTVGNRHVNDEEVPFDAILSSIAEHYGFKVIYDFRRNILKNKTYVDTKAQNFKGIKKETVIVLKKI